MLAVSQKHWTLSPSPLVRIDPSPASDGGSHWLTLPGSFSFEGTDIKPKEKLTSREFEAGPFSDLKEQVKVPPDLPSHAGRTSLAHSIGTCYMPSVCWVWT